MSELPSNGRTATSAVRPANAGSTTPIRAAPKARLGFVGGSDARIIMGDDEGNLVRLWREKRGEIEPEDLRDNLIVQLGTVTEHLNRHWYEKNTGQVVAEGTHTTKTA